MPRVYKVESARKDYPEAGIKKGDTYYHWEFRFGGKRKSKTYPKPSQLTQSAFLQQLYSIQEIGLPADESLKDIVEDIAGQLRDLGEEQQNSLDNMPEGLQQGSTGEMLQTRIDSCESVADEIENIDLSGPDTDEEKEDPETYWADKVSEIEDLLNSVETG